MSHLRRFVQMLVASTLISACKPYEPAKIDVDTEAADKILGALNTCNAKAATPRASESDPRNQLTLTDEIANKDIEILDCNDTTTGRQHGPVREFNRDIVIEPLQVFGSAVTSVAVRNSRTCVDFTLQTSANPPVGSSPELATVPMSFSRADNSGRVSLKVTDSTFKILDQFNVRDGLNSIELTYYGKCLDEVAPVTPVPAETTADPESADRAPVETTPEDGGPVETAPVEGEPAASAIEATPVESAVSEVKAAVGCKNPEVLGTRVISLQINIDRPEVEGLIQRRQCKPTTTEKSRPADRADVLLN